MKTSAFILLIGFLTYFSETIVLPQAGICAGAAKASCCANKINGGQACAAMHHDKQNQKLPRQACHNTICFDCPLCYTMLPVNGGNITAPFTLCPRVYSIANSNTVTGFVTCKWKPPNAA